MMMMMMVLQVQIIIFKILYHKTNGLNTFLRRTFYIKMSCKNYTPPTQRHMTDSGWWGRGGFTSHWSLFIWSGRRESASPHPRWILSGLFLFFFPPPRLPTYFRILQNMLPPERLAFYLCSARGDALPKLLATPSARSLFCEKTQTRE